jgi:hypothetical protein
MSTTESIARGAKQLVVETTARTSPLWVSRAFLSASRSVYNSSPTSFGSMTMGVRFAAVIAFRQVFWSIRGQITYLHSGR